jgi:hypothetical protein
MEAGSQPVIVAGIFQVLVSEVIMIANHIARSVERIYMTAGATPWHAMQGLPKLGSEPDDLKGFSCVTHTAELIPRGFFDWLFRRPNRYKVTSRFVPFDSSPLTAALPIAPDPVRFPPDFI